MTPAGASFRLRDVTVAYAAGAASQGAALRRVNLEVAAGERLGLVGPSGAGKTSLLRLVNAAVRAQQGAVEFAGQDLGTLGPRPLRRLRAEIAMVHQDLRLIPQLRVLHNVLAGRLGRLSLLRTLAWYAWPPRARLEEVYDLLGRVGIPDKLYERTDRLSGGEQQRVAIARALFQQPRVLLADEPVASVDPARARDTLALLVGLCRDEGLTFVVSLHDLALAREFLPRLVGLRGGRVVFDRPTKELSDGDFEALYRLPEAPP